jgi:hypothetical protein
MAITQQDVALEELKLEVAEFKLEVIRLIGASNSLARAIAHLIQAANSLDDPEIHNKATENASEAVNMYLERASSILDKLTRYDEHF